MVQGGGPEPFLPQGCSDPGGEASKANGGHYHGGDGQAPLGEVTSGHDCQNPRIEKVNDAAKTVPAGPPRMKEQPRRRFCRSNWLQRF